MSDENNKENFIDKNGIKWKFLSEKPCNRKLEPRKLTFKIRFEVECEMELIESQKSHKHIVRKKEHPKFIDKLKQILYGDIKDFGYSDCFVLQSKTKTNVKVIQNEIIEELYKEFPDNYSFTDKEIFKNWEHYFILQIEYLKKHLSKALEKVPKQIFKRFDNNLKNSTKSNFKDDSAKFTKRISEIKEQLRKDSKRINKTNVGRAYYGKLHSNPIQQLDRDLDLYLFDDLDEIP